MKAQRWRTTRKTKRTLPGQVEAVVLDVVALQCLAAPLRLALLLAAPVLVVFSTACRRRSPSAQLTLLAAQGLACPSLALRPIQ